MREGQQEQKALQCAQHIIRLMGVYADEYRDSWLGGESHLAKDYMRLRNEVKSLREALAAETCARSAPITVGDTQGEKCAKCGGSGYAIDTERSGVGRVVGKKCDCGSVAYITNGNPTPHAGGTDA